MPGPTWKVNQRYADAQISCERVDTLGVSNVSLMVVDASVVGGKLRVSYQGEDMESSEKGCLAYQVHVTSEGVGRTVAPSPKRVK